MALICDICGYKSNICHILKCPRCNSLMASEVCGSCNKCKLNKSIFGLFINKKNQ